MPRGSGKRRYHALIAWSAVRLPSKTLRECGHSRWAAQCHNRSFGAGEEHGRDREAERFRGAEIDDEIELGRLLDRDVSWLCPTQNLVDEIGGPPKHVRKIRSIRHQARSFEVGTGAVHRGQSLMQGQGVDLNAIGVD